MTRAEIIALCDEGVRQLLVNESSGHDYYHCARVMKLAESIAEKEGADAFTCALAGLLHDIDDVKVSPGTSLTKQNARALMGRCGLSAEFQDRICVIIDEISFRGTGGVTPSSPEGCCVQDADRLDALGAIGIARTFAFGGKHSRALYDPENPPREFKTEEEYRSANSSSLNHFYEKLFRLTALMNTETAKAEAGRREKFMRDFTDEFMLEWNPDITRKDESNA